MAMTGNVWLGPEIQARVRRASGRAAIGMGMLVASDTKRLTHRISGTLARSVHAAEVGADHGTDAESALAQDLMLTKGLPDASHTPEGAAVEVGSWLDYACVEWIGRGHPGITEGLEGVRGARATAVVMRAFREEGL